MTTIGCRADGINEICASCKYKEDLLNCFLYRNKERRTIIGERDVLNNYTYMEEKGGDKE